MGKKGKECPQLRGSMNRYVNWNVELFLGHKFERLKIRLGRWSDFLNFYGFGMGNWRSLKDKIFWKKDKLKVFVVIFEK